MIRRFRGMLPLLLLLFGAAVPLAAQYMPSQAPKAPPYSAIDNVQIVTGTGSVIENGLRSAEAFIGSTLTGKWTVTITTEQGEFDTNWDLLQHEDGTLTGDIEGRRGSSPAEGGWVKGDRFGFSVTRDFQGRTFEIDYAGTLAADALHGTLTAGDGQFTAAFTGVRADADGENR